MSYIRKHLSYTNVAVTLALVFAMTGGAYAASHYVITSPKQIKPSVLKALKGKDGKNGTNGATGTNGANGATGPAGPAGAQGPQGTAGAKGEQGIQGIQGKPGQTGFTETLPSKKTETGAWVLGPAAAGGPVKVALSFAIPLAASLSDEKECEAGHPCQAHVINVAGEEINAAKEEHSKFCKGTVTEPTAEPGNLCVYTASGENIVFSQVFGGIVNPATGTDLGVSGEGAGTTGAVLSAAATEPGGTAFGSWAVTAP